MAARNWTGWVLACLPACEWNMSHWRPSLGPLIWCPIFNTLRPRQNGRHFPDDIFKCIFLNENVWISIKITLNLVPKGPISNISALVQIMAWRRPGDKPLSEPMMVSLLTHICVTRPQWVKSSHFDSGIRKWTLGVIDLQISWGDLTKQRGYQNSSLNNGLRARCPNRYHFNCNRQTEACMRLRPSDVMWHSSFW